jgi:hypothetical protein
VFHWDERESCLPGGEVLATFGYGRIEVTENVGVDRSDRIFFLRAWNKVDTTERLELGNFEYNIIVNHRRSPTISASSYSSKTSRVERRVPLRIVGSSVKGD